MIDQKPTIICLIGQTCSGKDTFAKLLNQKFDYNIICSYTTRPKRDSETDKVEHIFISEEEYNSHYKDLKKIAYTEINGYKYFVLFEDICSNKNDSFIYIIDPKGYYELKENYSTEFNIILIHLYANKEIRKARYEKREYNTSIPFEDREKAEKEQFEEFENRLYMSLTDYAGEYILEDNIQDMYNDYHMDYDMSINTSNIDINKLV